MSKKILIGAICVVGVIVALSFSGQVPRKSAREVGMVVDTHAKNNLGQLYQVSYSSDAVKEAKSFLFLINLATNTFTSDRIHARIKTGAENNAEVRFYESPTLTSSGTVVNEFNRNRELNTASGARFFIHPLASDNGTMLSTEIISDHVSMEPPTIQEWILPSGNFYMIEMLDKVSGTAGNDMNVIVEYFETTQ